jgi:solute carrier family 25 carnitine/acylcarnitine transporter 20/29
MLDDLKNLLPGFCQGITRVTISYPFDVIKVNMQKLIFKNTIESVTHIYKNDPYKFYRGSFLSYTSVSLERSIQFYCLEKMNKNNNNPYVNGLILALFSSIYNVPVQFLTTNIALTNSKQYNTINYIKSLNKNLFYKGIGLEISRSIINTTIFNGTYFYLRNTYGENTKLAPLYGAISGISFWLITFPLDTLRTEYQSSTHSLKQIIINKSNSGLTTFYRGLTPVLIRTIPSASCGMYVYELVKYKLS